MSDFTPVERGALEVGDLVIVGRGRVIWRVASFWRTTATGMVLVQLVRTDRPDSRRSVAPASCRLLKGVTPVS
jgi:hypothetical protein